MQKYNGKKIVTMLVLVMALMICITGATYAYFAVSATNTGVTGTAATVSLTLNVTRETPNATKWNASTKVMVPQLTGALGNAMNSTNNCVDGNGNVVCEVLKIVITNASTAAVKLKGTLHFTNSSGGAYSNLYWQKVTDANTIGTGQTKFKASTVATTNSATAGAANSLLVNPLSLTANGGSQTYYVVVWIEETNADQKNNDKGTWTANVNFTDSATGNGVTSTIVS